MLLVSEAFLCPVRLIHPINWTKKSFIERKVFLKNRSIFGQVFVEIVCLQYTVYKLSVFLVLCVCLYSVLPVMSSLSSFLALSALSVSSMVSVLLTLSVLSVGQLRPILYNKTLQELRNCPI